jgi:hypothetical protein
MKKRYLFLFSLFLYLSIGWLVSCSRYPMQSTPSVTSVDKTSVPLTITRTSTPEMTPTLTPTIEPSETTTQIFTPTVTTPPVFFRLLTHGPLPNWQYLVTFENDNPVSGEYLLIVDKNKEYTCFTRADHPNYLYCAGSMAGIDTTVEFTLYAMDTKVKILTGEIYIPLKFAP